MVYSIHNIKMVDRDGNREWRECLAQGRDRTLIEALEAVETR